MNSAISFNLCDGHRRATVTALLVIGILLWVPKPSLGWTPAWVSASSFGGAGTDGGLTVRVDRDGNRYVTGAFSATAYFALVASVPMNESHGAQNAFASKALTSAGGTDVFLAKYDQSGKLKWLTQAGGSRDDVGYDLAFDAMGNVYVTGSFIGSVTFRGINHTDQTVSGPEQTIFLAKYRPSGELAWVQTGTVPTGNNEGFGVAVEPGTGSIYVTDISQGETTFSSSNGTTHAVAAPFTWHMILVKYDTAGNFQWGQSNEATPNSLGHKVAIDADNSAYVTGWMEGHVIFHSNDGRDWAVDGFSGPVQTFPDYPGDAFVVKYDAHGNVQWVNHIGGYKAIGVDIATSRDGRVSVTGLIGNVADSAPQAQTIVTSQPGGKEVNLHGGNITRPYNKDVFFATWDEDGELLEARRFGGPKDEAGSGIAYDRRGNLTLAGIFQDTIRIAGRTLTENGSSNLFVARFTRQGESCFQADPDGQNAFGTNALNWVMGARGPFVGAFFLGLEGGPRIGLTARGDVLVTGEYEPAAQFGGFTLPSAGGQDGFLALLKVPEKGDQR